MNDLSEISPAQWQRLDELLAKALQHPAGERAEFLASCHSDDPAVAGALAALLALEAEAPPFLEGDALSHAAPFLPDREDPFPAPGAGERVGAYRLVREIGRGGMGVVYLAERDDRTFQKRVAVKLIQPALADPRFRARFAAERAILARLEHPAIARILDGGETGQGIPYFVMEYAEGERVDAYCDDHALDVEARLTLFLKIGEAVAYAHQNLVVHRDLKPGNVLVSAGEVKLLDFGIAKALADTEGGTPTGSLDQVMTTAYASPEQIRGLPVRTVSDVYSLGVVLYELLTGHRPYLAAARLHEFARAILEDEPLRPSAAVAVVQERLPNDDRPAITPESVSARRSTDVKRLQRRLRGDLDAIVRKALRKEPERRYASVDALLEDIRRHLEGKPVAARGDVVWYRLGKLARRRWATLTTAAVTITVLALSFVFYARQIHRERDGARREAAKAQATTGFLVSLFQASDPYATPHPQGEGITARTLLERSAERIQRELTDQPEVRAALLESLGHSYLGLGLVDRAQGLVEQSLALRRRLFGDRHAEVADSIGSLGDVRMAQGDYARAEELFREGHALRVQLFGPESLPSADSLQALGRAQRRRGDFAAAEASVREALRIRRRLLGEEHKDVAECLQQLAVLRDDRGDLREAEALARRTVDLKRRLYGEEHPNTISSLGVLAYILSDKGDLQGAEPILRRVLELDRKLLGEGHPDVGVDANNLASLLMDKGDLEEAERLMRESVRITRETQGDEHPELAVRLNNLGNVLQQKGDFDGAETVLRQAIAIRRKALGPRHPRLAHDLDNLATIARKRGDLEEAVRLHRQALSARQGVLPDDHPDFAHGFAGLGRALAELKRPAEGEPFLRQSLRIREKALPARHYLIGVSKSWLGECLAAQKRYEEAEPLLVDGLDILQETRPQDQRAAGSALGTLIKVYEATGRPALARPYRERLQARADTSSQSPVPRP